jgi:hypothetical protein
MARDLKLIPASI